MVMYVPRAGELTKKRGRAVETVAKRTTDEVDIWAVAARQYDKSYGQYVAAVERHGTLPPPERAVIRLPAKMTRKCARCGIEFPIEATPCRVVSKRKLCDDCRALNWAKAKRESVKRSNERKKQEAQK